MKDALESTSLTRTDFPRVLGLALITFFAAATVYLPTLANEFTYDDITIVRDNPMIRGLDKAPAIFASAYTEKTYMSFTRPYRPLVIFSFALNHAAFGNSSFSFHLVNLLLHAANSVLVFLLLLALFRNSRISFCAALLFALHPVASEAVCPAVGRCDTLVAFFSMLFLLYYVRSWERGTRLRDVLIASIFLFCALLSKENAIVMVALPPICDALFRDGMRAWLRRLNRRAAAYGVFAGVAFLYLAVRYVAVGTLFTRVALSPLDNPLTMFDGVVRFFANGKVFLLYLFRLLFPLHLSNDYSYNQVNFEGGLKIEGLVFLGVLAAIVWLLVHTYRKERRMFFGLVFFGITFSVISNFVVKIDTVMAERLLYLPLVGFAVVVCCAIERAAQFLKSDSARRLAVIVVICAISTLFAVRTVLRTFDWRDNYTLFASALKVSPNSAKMHRCYAQALLARGDREEAVAHYKRALSIFFPHKDDWLQFHVMQTQGNIADIYVEMGNTDQAVEYYRSVLKGYFTVLEQFRRTRATQEDIDRILSNLRYGVSIEKIFSAVRKIFSERGLQQEAQEALEHTILIDGESRNAHNELAITYFLAGAHKAAEREVRHGIARSPKNAYLHNTLGIILAETGRPEEARSEFEQALRLDPNMRAAKDNLERLLKSR